MKIIALLLVLPLGITANVDTFLEFQTQVTNTAEFQLPATSTTTFDHSSFLTTSILFSSITDSSLSALYTTTILTELATHVILLFSKYNRRKIQNQHSLQQPMQSLLRYILV